MWIIIGVTVVILIVILCISGSKLTGKNNLVLLNKWKNLTNELQEKGITQTSQINIDSVHYCKAYKGYLPEYVISIDSKSSKLVVSSITNVQKDERANYISCEFHHDVFDFKQIKGGKLLELGESAKSVGSTVSAPVGNTSLVGGISSSNITAYIDKMIYKLHLNDIDNPEYTIVFTNRKEAKTSLWYQSHYERAQKLNTIIESIVNDNVKA